MATKTLFNIHLFPLFIFLFFFSNGIFAQYQWDWAKGFGAGFGNSIAVDAQGNSYVTGYINGTSTFDGTVVSPDPNADSSPFVAKYNGSGQLVWVKPVIISWPVESDAPPGGTGTGITLNSKGEILITGYFSGIASFGSTATGAPVTLTIGDPNQGQILEGPDGTLQTNGFIAKYNANGDIIWAVQCGTNTDPNILTKSYSRGIAIDRDNYSYVTGSFQGWVQFGNTIIHTLGGPNVNVFVAKFDDSGTMQWVTQAGGTEVDGGTAIATDHLGNCFITGNYTSSSANFGPFVLNSQSLNPNLFVSCLDQVTGQFKWLTSSIQLDNNTFVLGTGVAADNAGGCFVSGQFSGSTIIQNTVLINAHELPWLGKYIYQGFVARYGADAQNWVNMIGGTDVAVTGISYHQGSGMVYVGGNISGGGYFDNGQVTVSNPPGFGTYYAFFAAFEQDGTFYLATRTSGPAGEPCINAVAAGPPYFSGGVWDGAKSVFVTGQNVDSFDMIFNNSLNVNSGPVMKNGEGFVAEYSMFPIVRVLRKEQKSDPNQTAFADGTRFRVFPNPTSSDIFIQYVPDNSGIVQIDLFNMLGEQVSSQEKEVSTGDNLIKVNTGGLGTGVYFLKVKKEESEYFEKIVVSK
jgi:hypothetical protein